MTKEIRKFPFSSILVASFLVFCSKWEIAWIWLRVQFELNIKGMLLANKFCWEFQNFLQFLIKSKKV